MASGHHLTHKLSSSELADLLEEALSHPKIQARLKRPFKLVTTKDISLLGSSSIGGLNVYLDQHLRHGNWPFGVLPVEGRRLDCKRGLIRHERLEQAVEDILGWPYSEIAHPIATVFEHRDYEHRGFDPKAVEKVYAPFIRADEREPLSNVPTDLDLRPMLKDANLLERTRRAQDARKITPSTVGYTDASRSPSRCASCAMFIAEKYGGPACTKIKGFVSPQGWCRLFSRGSLDKT